MPKIEGAMRDRLRSLWAAILSTPLRLVSFLLLMFALLAILILSGLYLSGAIDYDFTRTPDERAESVPSASSTATSTPASTANRSRGPTVDNPTGVGQALDAIAQPAIAEVYGDAQLQHAPTTEALIVSLSYDIPQNPGEGDADKLRDAFIRRGARVDPDNYDVDHHAGEEFILLMDTGNPDYKTVRVSVSPGIKAVYVNADRSE